MTLETAQQPKWRLALFAFGDFGFNLYWQSLSLFLLFYYTETLGFGIAAAGAAYMLASVFDGLAGFAIGLWIDRRANPCRFPTTLMIGAAPLALTFVLAYLPPDGTGLSGLIIICASQFLFRLAYAVTNLSYLAMSARVSFNPGDRALVAGMRMIWGAIATLIVSLATRPLGALLAGSESRAYLASAIVFALIATIVLLFVGATYRDAACPGPAGKSRDMNTTRTVKSLLVALAGNRSFLFVAGAMITMIIGVTMVSKTVLYYFTYALGSTRAGELTLADMTLVGLVAVPLWMLLERRIGTRRTWSAAINLALILLLGLAVFGASGQAAAHGFLAAFQGAVMGLDFALWALLPATIDEGEMQSGARVEAALFGLVAMLQRVAIGVATGLMGANLQLAGLQMGAPLSEGTSLGIRLQISVIPCLFFAASAILILRSGVAATRAFNRTGA